MKSEQGLPAFGGAKGDQVLPARFVAGFTMLELLVTIIILSVLLGLAIPGFMSWLPNYRLRGAARDLFSNLQLAKSGAIKDRTEWAVRFTGPNSYEVWSARDPDNPSQNTGWNSFSATDDTLVKTVNLSDYGSGLQFGAGSASSAVDGGAITAVPAGPIYFGSRGFTTNNASVYAYMTNNRNTSYAVGALASGAVVIRKWNGATWQ